MLGQKWEEEISKGAEGGGEEVHCKKAGARIGETTADRG